MEADADTWENCNSMLYTHNWWHIALYYLERGEQAKVLQLGVRPAGLGTCRKTISQRRSRSYFPIVATRITRRECRRSLAGIEHISLPALGQARTGLLGLALRLCSSQSRAQ